MILAVEGISAAGKTSWCRAHAAAFTVPENGRLDDAPDRLRDPGRAASFWADRNADRWRAALEVEARHGVAVCDTDPLKLHYAWGLLQLGELTRETWEFERAATRDRVAAGALGFADRVLLIVPDVAEARRRRDADPTRKRRNFERHARLGPSLVAWYRALEAARPGTVVTSQSLPDALPDGAVRDDRYDLAAFDRLTVALPDLSD